MDNFENEIMITFEKYIQMMIVYFQSMTQEEWTILGIVLLVSFVIIFIAGMSNRVIIFNNGMDLFWTASIFIIPILFVIIGALLKENNSITEQELIYFNRYLEEFADDPWFLNRYSWRMTEINENLELALVQINIALNLLQDNEDGYANIIDTKAEILWKMGLVDEAVMIIEEAILIDEKTEYYKNQKTKFLNSKKEI